ncbi:NAD-dependent SIR2 family protein deacetylase [Pseudarthrobacter defluvii]|uniref:NAD-dependent protein deacetylase n=1 Tax=Pseudarthrobacter defluvii TaxID=410837 RepID=UPI0027891218|nr:NAD-dependent protein deacetylase [Pseudarthrobacter defluvii]MDQ0768797.1 NAD-dependent SIR2 family protein deacetylase [Pseudarthrobacter defluvii]
MPEQRAGTGLTGFASMKAVPPAPPSGEELEVLARIRDLLAGAPFALLTGAGLSTDSGIPDYRGPDSPPRSPMTYQEFVRHSGNRQRYWARNHIGWSHMRHADPNQGHYSAAELERRGYLTGLITQNVDRLHQDAGSSNVVDLHGRYDQVICLDCGRTYSRQLLVGVFQELNPGFLERAAASGLVEMAPDADATVEDQALIDSFVVALCPACGGTLKPDFVYFGENVPKERVERSYALVDQAAALVVAGSSLTVMSGLRFVRHAAKEDKPVVIINRGPTRGDDRATIKLEAGVSQALGYLAAELPSL